MASKKDLNPLIKRARKAGWTIEPTRGDHLRWNPPGGGMPYFSSATPSDKRAIRNIESGLIKLGLAKAS